MNWTDIVTGTMNYIHDVQIVTNAFAWNSSQLQRQPSCRGCGEIKRLADAGRYPEGGIRHAAGSTNFSRRVITSVSFISLTSRVFLARVCVSRSSLCTVGASCLFLYTHDVSGCFMLIPVDTRCFLLVPVHSGCFMLIPLHTRCFPLKPCTQWVIHAYSGRHTMFPAHSCTLCVFHAYSCRHMIFPVHPCTHETLISVHMKHLISVGASRSSRYTVGVSGSTL